MLLFNSGYPYIPHVINQFWLSLYTPGYYSHDHELSLKNKKQFNFLVLTFIEKPCTVLTVRRYTPITCTV